MKLERPEVGKFPSSRFHLGVVTKQKVFKTLELVWWYLMSPQHPRD